MFETIPRFQEYFNPLFQSSGTSIRKYSIFDQMTKCIRSILFFSLKRYREDERGNLSDRVR